MHINRKGERLIIFAVTIGSLLEWYEIFLYVYWTPIISRILFDYPTEIVNTINTLLVFAFGFLSRPIGGLIFGYIGDRWGRKISFVISIVIVSLPSIAIGLTPSFLAWSYFAQIFVAIMRLMQGIPAGGELPGAICYLSESAIPGRKKYLCSYAFVGAQIGAIIAMVECLLLEKYLSHQVLITWGWRFSFLIGGLFGLLGFFLRSKLKESPMFQHLKELHEVLKKPITESFKRHKEKMLIGFCVAIFEVVGFYTISIFPALYFKQIFNISDMKNVVIIAILLTVSAVTIPIFGKVSERYNTRFLLISSALGVIFVSFPFYQAINRSDFFYTIVYEIILIFFLNIQFALLPSFLAELFPTRVRFTCVAFSFNTCDSIIGGLTPILGIYLIKSTGNNAAFVLLLVLSALISLPIFNLVKERRENNNHHVR